MRRARLIKVFMVAVVLLIGGGALALAKFSGNNNGDFHGAPVPALFDDAQLSVVHDALKLAETEGHRTAKAWLDAHPVTTDAAFAKWAEDAVGPPPGGDSPGGELNQLKAIA